MSSLTTFIWLLSESCRLPALRLIEVAEDFERLDPELRREVHRGATTEQGDGPERQGHGEDKDNEGKKEGAACVEEQAEEEVRI